MKLHQPPGIGQEARLPAQKHMTGRLSVIISASRARPSQAPSRHHHRRPQLQGAPRPRPLSRPPAASAEWVLEDQTVPITGTTNSVLARLRPRPPGLPHQDLDPLRPPLPALRRAHPRPWGRLLSQAHPAARPDLAPRRLGARPSCWRCLVRLSFLLGTLRTLPAFPLLTQLETVPSMY